MKHSARNHSCGHKQSMILFILHSMFPSLLEEFVGVILNAFSLASLFLSALKVIAINALRSKGFHILTFYWTKKFILNSLFNMLMTSSFYILHKWKLFFVLTLPGCFIVIKTRINSCFVCKVKESQPIHSFPNRSGSNFVNHYNICPACSYPFFF